MDELTMSRYGAEAEALSENILDVIQVYGDANMMRPRFVASVSLEALMHVTAVILSALPRDLREKSMAVALPKILEQADRAGGEKGIIDALSNRAANDG